jgi:hypothetical protein
MFSVITSALTFRMSSGRRIEHVLDAICRVLFSICLTQPDSQRLSWDWSLSGTTINSFLVWVNFRSLSAFFRSLNLFHMPVPRTRGKLIYFNGCNIYIQILIMHNKRIFLPTLLYVHLRYLAFLRFMSLSTSSSDIQLTSGHPRPALRVDRLGHLISFFCHCFILLAVL